MTTEEAKPEPTLEELKVLVGKQSGLVTELNLKLAHATDLLEKQDEQYKKDLGAAATAKAAQPLVVYPLTDKKLRKFFGNPFYHKEYLDVEEWLDEADAYLESKSSRPEKEKIRFLVDALSGNAKPEVMHT